MKKNTSLTFRHYSICKDVRGFVELHASLLLHHCRILFAKKKKHCILSAELTKPHSFRLYFWRFCPLGNTYNLVDSNSEQCIIVKCSYINLLNFLVVQ